MPDPDWLDPTFNLPAGLLATALASYLVLGEPLLGRWMYRRLQQQRDHDPTALVRFFRLTLAIQAAFVVTTIATLIVAPGAQARHVGLAWPSGPLLWPATAFTAYLLIVVTAAGLVMRRRAHRGQTVPGQDAFAAMLPRTPVERRYALGVAVGAGISEELAFRGLLIAAGVGLLGLSPYLAAATLVIVFGLAHLYQGVGGVFATVLLGALLSGLYLVTGSLLLPVITHVAIDLRGLLFVPATSRSADDTTATAETSKP